MMPPRKAVLRQNQEEVRPPELVTSSDAHLLEVFAVTRSPEAFEVLLRRHGPMVRGACLRVLGNEADADDAFQATFLVLARKAGALGRPEALSAWLFGVASRTARKVRTATQRRRRREEAVAAMTRDQTPDKNPLDDIRPLLDEEIERLPEKYRLPLVLRHLEGVTTEEVARRLRCSEGAVKMRLLRARDLLRGRLGRRGVVLSIGVFATLFAQQVAPAALPEQLVGVTVQAATSFAAGSAVGAASAAPAALAEGVLRSMFSVKIGVGLFLALVLSALGVGVALTLGRDRGADQKPPVADRKERAPTPPADRALVVKGGNEFALDLYGRLRGQAGNIFLSPSSISSALAMTYAGARGETAEEMARALHFRLPNERLHPAFAELIDGWNGGGKKRSYQLRVANALWAQTGFPFRPDFLALNRDCYSAGLTSLDIAGETEASRKTINAWVEKQTENKIPELLQKGMLKPNTSLVLTNAIYFKGSWKQKFDKRLTQDDDFHVSEGKKVRVPMMLQMEKLRYRDFGDYKAIELPYAGEDLSMLILLPARRDGLGKLEASLTPALIEGCLAKLSPGEHVKLILPRFQITAQYDLVPPLKAAGMRRAFERADFSGISESSGLAITDVVHKAFVEVNEEGTEAAAATGVQMAVSAPVCPEFFANHPFLFLIHDNRSGAILFIGRVLNPSAG